MVKRMLLVICLAFILPARAQEAMEPIAPDIGARVAERYAAPSVTAFQGVAARLHGKMEQLCAEPGMEGLDEARAAFADTVTAWAAVSILRFGPLVEENRFERLFFWPDVRGAILRQVQGVLAAQDEDAATVAGLSGKSVALQGLPALEYVLHGTGSEALSVEALSYRCRYGAAIAGNVAARAAELVEAWAPGASFRAEFADPSPDDALYRSPKEVAGEVVKALGTGLQFIRNAELLPALGDSPERANGKRAPFWRSDLTFDLVGAQIAGIMALFEAADFEARLGEADRAIAGSVRFDLEHALGAIEEIHKPAEAAFADDEDRGRITYVGAALEGANRTIGEQLSVAIGLTMGFNALDGD